MVEEDTNTRKMINADDLADWRAAGNWVGMTLNEVVDMRDQERAVLVEDFWNLEDAHVKVEEAFEELVEKRVELMRELASSSKKELTKTFMKLLEYEGPGVEKVVMSEQEKIRLTALVRCRRSSRSRWRRMIRQRPSSTIKSRLH